MNVEVEYISKSSTDSKFIAKLPSVSESDGFTAEIVFVRHVITELTITIEHLSICAHPISKKIISENDNAVMRPEGPKRREGVAYGKSAHHH